MQARTWMSSVALILCVLGLAYAGWRSVQRTEAGNCYVCNRPVHAHSKTVALVNGHPKTFCCPACALSEHGQEGKPVTLTRLTEYLTGKELAPDQAYIVRGSDVNPCVQNEGLVDADKQPAALHFDRCRPGMLSFARLDEAARFAREHGGQVLAFKELRAAYAK